jgi:NitT/TauT family transport system ATP-binding protein
VTEGPRAEVAPDAPAPSKPVGARPTCISARSVRHVFPDGTVALDGIDLEIATGSFVSLVGPSGCGKSTLLRLVSGLDVPTSGKLEVLGGSPSAEPRASETERLAFVFQDAHLLPWRTVIDNVALPLELRRVPRAEARKQAERAVADVELDDARSRFPDELSGGMRMRVSIARALVTEPQLLLMDEPFAALDELTRQRLDERLRALWARRRMTVLFVTHSLSEAVFLSDRAVVMSHRPGRIVLDRTVDLPADRASWLRTEVAFAQEMSMLREALEAYGGSKFG